MGLWKTVFPVLLLSILGWQSNIVNSSAIFPKPIQVASPANNLHPDSLDPNNTVLLFQEALSEYSELANTYYAPGQDEAVREKRTLAVIRKLANSTRTGFATLRNLFGGAGGAGGSGAAGGGFRTFFSNLLNRLLVFMTNLWDRITGFFRGEGSGGAGGGGAGGGLLGRLGGLFSIFRPPTTTENYFDSDFSYYSTPSSALPEKENEVVATDEAVAAVSGGTSVSDTKAKSDENEADASDDFPFPGDSDISARNGKALERSSGSPAALAVGGSSGGFPHVVKSPSVIHLLDDGRRFARDNNYFSNDKEVPTL